MTQDIKTELLPWGKAVLPTGTDLSSGEVACLPDDVLFLTRTDNIKTVYFPLFSKSLIYPPYTQLIWKIFERQFDLKTWQIFLLFFKSLVDALWIWPALTSFLQPRPSLGDCYVHFLDLSKWTLSSTALLGTDAPALGHQRVPSQEVERDAFAESKHRCFVSYRLLEDTVTSIYLTTACR